MRAYRRGASCVATKPELIRQRRIRNPAPLPMHPRADQRAARSLILRCQYYLGSVRAWQRGKQEADPSAPSAAHLQLQCAHVLNQQSPANKDAAALGTREVLLRTITGWRLLLIVRKSSHHSAYGVLSLAQKCGASAGRLRKSRYFVIPLF